MQSKGPAPGTSPMERAGDHNESFNLLLVPGMC